MMSMPHDFKFLVDVNLPKHFSFFNDDCFCHVIDINPTMTDNEIWEYAKSNTMIILTKDTDFYYRFLLDDECPRVVYFKLGNMTLKTLHGYFSKFWPEIIAKLNSGSLIIASRSQVKIVF